AYKSSIALAMGSVWGEKIVLRAQQNKPVELSFSELGMTDNQQQAFQRVLSQPQGQILVTLE
ncbi:ATPase, T2SS/T4P/T4SS family, partial [Klebsiella aerogenes]|uniref:ATPase, T2SS/T4P/T4SS family n=1 Tax=Klebsiella aerogenes TaxID=548 RepID=UPI001953CE4A